MTEFIVTTALDEAFDGTETSGAPDGAGLSLREAIGLANLDPETDTITFSPDFDGGSADLIRLTAGQIAITANLIIDGGASGVTITGDALGDDVRVLESAVTDAAASHTTAQADNSRIFDGQGRDLSLELIGLTLTGGRVSGDFNGGGGAVRVDGELTLVQSAVLGNVSTGRNAGGGGVRADERLVLIDSVLSGNLTTGDSAGGGGAASGGDMEVLRSTLTNNYTNGFYSGGGGASARDRLVVTNSTITNNITSGERSDGGGVYAGGYRAVEIESSTFSGNTVRGAADGDAVGVSLFANYGLGVDVTVRNSIVLGDIDGDVEALGRNVIDGQLLVAGVDAGSVTAAELFAVTEEIDGVAGGVLADNGGPTPTILILAGGPAQDAGSAAPVFATDQRGEPRVAGAAIDLGSLELSSTIPQETPSLVVTTAADVVDATDFETSLREAVALANATPGADAITFSEAFDGEAADVIRLALGQIDVSETLTIAGGSAGVTISGENASRVLAASAGDLTLSGLTITGGRITRAYETGAGLAGGPGLLTLIDSTLTGNSADTYKGGGGGAAGSEIMLIRSTISDNFGPSFGFGGGGLRADVVTAIGSTIARNTTSGYSVGGGIYADTVTLIDSTVTGNAIGSGYSGNGYSGGGVFAREVALHNSIVSGNAAGFSEVARVVGYGAFGVDVTRASDVVGALTLTGSNAVGDGLFEGDERVGDTDGSRLFAVTRSLGEVAAGVLDDNGGPTPTVLLRAGGDAQDGGGASAEGTDQRGLARVVGAAPDLGALELRGGERAVGDIFYRVNVGGPALAAADGSALPWAADDRIAASPFLAAIGPGWSFMNAGRADALGPVELSDPGIPAAAPAALFDTERYDQSGEPTMAWAFPLAAGRYAIDLYFAELWSGVRSAGERVFDVAVEGTVPVGFDDIDAIASAGPAAGFVRTAVVEVVDGVLNLDFLPGSQNPDLNAIEIRRAPNRAPEALDDMRAFNLEPVFAIDVLRNDMDPDGDHLTIVAATDGNFGETVILGDKIFYNVDAIGDPDFSGDSFTYTVEDPWGARETATVTLTPPPPPPVILSLIDVETDATLMEVRDGEVIELAALGADADAMDIRLGFAVSARPGASLEGAIGSVELALSYIAPGDRFRDVHSERIENVAPYALFGDDPVTGDFFEHGSADIDPREYQLVATVWEETNAQGAMLGLFRFDFEIV